MGFRDCRVRLQRADVMTALDAVPQQPGTENYADVDERTPLVVPALAINRDPRPGRVERPPHPPDAREDVDRHTPLAHREVAALLEILWRPLALESLLEHGTGDHQIGKVDHDDRDRRQ